MTINHQNFEGSIGLNVPDENWFIISKDGKLAVFQTADYKQSFEIDLNLEKSDTREPFEIISMIISPDHKYIAVVVGK